MNKSFACFCTFSTLIYLLQCVPLLYLVHVPALINGSILYSIESKPQALPPQSDGGLTYFLHQLPGFCYHFLFGPRSRNQFNQWHKVWWVYLSQKIFIEFYFTEKKCCKCTYSAQLINLLQRERERESIQNANFSDIIILSLDHISDLMSFS